MKRSLFIFLATVLIPIMGNGQTVTGNLLWKISGNGLPAPSYILATHHTAPASILPQLPGFEQAWAGSEVYAGEINLDEFQTAQPLFFKYASMPEGITYEDILNEEDYNFMVKTAAKYFDAPLSNYTHFKPEFLKNIFSSGISVKLGLLTNPMDGPDAESYLHTTAAKEGKVIAGLETVDDQLRMLYTTDPVEVQAERMICFLRNPVPEIESVKDITEAYYAGDLDRIYRIGLLQEGLPCGYTDTYRRALNTDRNEKWLPKIIEWSSRRPVFYAVGMLHLAGKEGLLARLRSMGYIVEEMK